MRFRKNLMRLLAVTAAASMLAAACGGGDDDGGNGGGDTGGGDNKEAVKIAFFGDLSGDYKLLVESGFNAAKLAFEQANASGDLPVEIQIEAQDTRASEDQAASLASKVVQDDSVVGVIGPAFSGESAAAGDTLDQAGIPFITQSATDDALSTHGWTHWFRSLGNNSSQAVPEAQYISQVLKPNCAFVASDGSAYGKGLADIAFDTIKKEGVEIPGAQEQVDPNSKDFSALVTKVQDSGCTALFYGGYSPQAGLIRKQLTAAGLDNVTIVGGDGIKDEEYLNVAGPEGKGTIAGCGCVDIAAVDDPDAEQFVSDYKAEYNEEPGIYAAEGWDVAQIFISAMEAGNTTREDITKYVADLQGFEGLTKTYTFEDNGELTPESVATFFYENTGTEWKQIGSSEELLS